jgi:aminomethyltransferase
VIDKNYQAYFSFRGPDRVRYLNAILTNNVKELGPRHGVVSLLLNPQGRILAEIETYALADTLLCVSYAMIREQLIDTLEKFIIMDDVTLADESAQYGTLGVEGPQAGTLVRDVTGLELSALEELERRETRVGTIAGALTRRSPGEFPGAEFLVARQDLETLWSLLEEKARGLDGGPMGYTALNALRLEQRTPWFSYDFGEKQIPHEAALENSHISYTKGCYTGQEIVERVRSRGQVNRRRVNLVFSGTAIPASGEVLSAGGKEAGYVTRAGFSPKLSSAIGMGYVRKENNSPGSELEWQSGKATVSAL